jgi:hypothetical protein
MSIKRPTEPWSMTAEKAANRTGYAAQAELVLRNALETFCRERWPHARVVHEIVMGEGRVRADVAAIDIAHIAAFEVKGQYDDTTRLLHQVGMYQLCVPEVWMVVPIGRHADDARLIRHLLPSVGLLVGAGTSKMNHYEFDGKDFGLVVEAEAAPRAPVPEMMLEMCWAAELVDICGRTRTSVGKKPTRKVMVEALLDLPVASLQAQVCTALRSRDALWRADAPVLPATSALVERPADGLFT